MKNKQIEELIKAEKKRQTDGLELIPSENYVSSDVLQALGSVFTNKYSEGYPGRRYYGGQENTDQVEQLAIDRAKKLFKADHANVQPHSEPKIILAGFSAYPRELDYEKFAEIGNEVGAMLMADMSHIAGLIVSGVAKNPFDYGFHVITTTTHKTLRGPRGGLILSRGIVGNPLKKPEKTLENLPTLIDRAVFPGTQGGPHMHTIAAKAVAFGEALQPEFKDYAEQIVKNAKRLAEELQKRGFKLVTGGTSNHLILADIRSSFGIDGKEAEIAMDKIGLTLNANAIPDDPLPRFRPSGIRLGTPAVTTRGAKEDDMKKIAEWMRRSIDNRDNDDELAELRKEVMEFCHILRDI